MATKSKKEQENKSHHLLSRVMALFYFPFQNLNIFHPDGKQYQRIH
jgi:hypothetical protein